jgi:predicted nucleic acid-binding protein
LLEARRRRLIPAVRPLLDGLVAAGFHLHPALIEHVLLGAGESSSGRVGERPRRRRR